MTCSLDSVVTLSPQSSTSTSKLGALPFSTVTSVSGVTTRLRGTPTPTKSDTMRTKCRIIINGNHGNRKHSSDDVCCHCYSQQEPKSELVYIRDTSLGRSPFCNKPVRHLRTACVSATKQSCQLAAAHCTWRTEAWLQTQPQPIDQLTALFGCRNARGSEMSKSVAIWLVGVQENVIALVRYYFPMFWRNNIR